MTEKELIKQLKEAKEAYHKKFAPAPEEAEKSRGYVLAYIMAHGGQPARKLGFAERFNINTYILRYLVPPQFVYGFAVLLLLAAGGALAAVSRNALPGERFYPAKLAIEKTQMRFVSNPAERAKVQMDMAGNRLREIRTITERSGEPDGQVEKALNHFVQDVQGARNNLRQAGDPQQVRVAASEMARRAVQYMQELEQTKAVLEQKEQTAVPTSAAAPISPAPATPALITPPAGSSVKTEPQPSQYRAAQEA